jgi:hypothetical protein
MVVRTRGVSGYRGECYGARPSSRDNREDQHHELDGSPPAVSRWWRANVAHLSTSKTAGGGVVSMVLPHTPNQDESDSEIRMSAFALHRNSPAVLTGVKGLRFAPVVVNGLGPTLTPVPLRRRWR